MKKFNVVSVLAGLSVALTGPTFAQEQAAEDFPDGPPRHHELKHHKKKRDRMHEYMMKKVDTNEDGQIDLSEYLANAEQRFKNMDLNGDGYVTREEQKEAGKIMREKHREMREKMRAERKAARKAAEGDSE
ncbi:hypothetical protein GCM10008090_21460 [Arenicella chitinivorans]|uniref:EF-hand domain-containing protein n=1 Tax=Arenicella chitinivorans TaxID=1329800 RepID=A0A918VLP3_9GAMM|nr:EF-hand domain-containing protein [Arenicella chitinivorans]GHA11405.1 hypothetical protein GCM10008090_21460 [Arenicella chitinivorans]